MRKHGEGPTSPRTIPGSIAANAHEDQMTIDIFLPFSADELPGVVGGMFLTSIMTAVKIMQLQKKFLLKDQPDALKLFEENETEDAQHAMLVEASNWVSIMMPEEVQQRLLGRADAIASAMLGKGNGKG